MSVTKKELEKLAVKITPQWRIQSYSKNNASASYIAYIDSRDVMNILDNAVGPENWQSDFKDVKGNLYAGIGINIEGIWIWKWDCGSESNIEKQKGEASDALKRAGVQWGIGRFLYELPIQFVKTNEIKKQNNYPYPIDDRGNKIKDISLHINKKLNLSFELKSVAEQILDEDFNNPPATEVKSNIVNLKPFELTEEVKTKAIKSLKDCETIDELLSKRDEIERYILKKGGIIPGWLDVNYRALKELLEDYELEFNKDFNSL